MLLEALDINIALGPDAPGRARSLVNHFTRGRISRVMRERAELLVSEIATNAVTHPRAAGDLRLQVALHGECLHVDVTDSGSGFSPPAHPQPRTDGGYGLYLLDTAADRWGVARGPRCRVWFELDGALTA